MKTLWQFFVVAMAICASAATQAVAQQAGTLFGTTGACNNAVPGGPCTQTSTLVQIDPRTGALVRTIGPVGFTVNGLAWDRTTGKLYASTAIGDVRFHGLITINTTTGAGTAVDSTVSNFGLDATAGESPVHSIAVDFFGFMFAWYDEFPPPPGVTDTFVQINKRTGVAVEFPDTGINTSANGLAFQTLGAVNVLWNIDSPRLQDNGTTTQTAYLINPLNGKPLLARRLSPPGQAALGDFNPRNFLYYGLDFVPFDPAHTTFLVLVEPFSGVVARVGQTVNNLHVIAFVKP
ncbi:MAG: hypothetical protein ACJ79W_01500 [Myxococcales bacterium]